MCFAWIDSFGSQDGDHAPNDETYGQDHFRHRGSRPGVRTSHRVFLCTLGQLCARTPTLLMKPTGACCWPTYALDGVVCHSVRPAHRTAPAHRCVGLLKAGGMETMLHGCVTWSPTLAHLAIPRAAHRRLLLRCIGWKRKPRDGYHMLSYARGTG